ncbi:oligopeptide transporter [Auricularia subglabra TFB-10046 SS5]|nr:oligopeptide transporter [Auricularia subglabra TFB-10046 SS5]
MEHLHAAPLTVPVVEKGDAYSEKEKRVHVEDASFDNEKLSVRGEADGHTYVRGEPVIEDGYDVSNFLVDVRDAGGQALTFRSIFMGTIMAGFGASVTQIYSFKPLAVGVSSVFLLLVIYTWGRLWERMPRRETFEGRGKVCARLAPIVHFINPGDFGMKEHVVATLLAKTAAHGSTAVVNFAIQRLFYNSNPGAVTAIMATFSTACFGYGLTGLLRPLSVYPSFMVYWASLPNVTVFQALHFDKGASTRRVKIFWMAVGAMAVYEVLPAYVFPLLNGVSVVCLATQHVAPGPRQVIGNIFGGANSNEGLGLFELSFDWQYLGSYWMSVPIGLQAPTWLGILVGYFALTGIYYTNAWQAKKFPFLSTSLFDITGHRYNQTEVFGTAFTLNETAYAIVGQPYLTGGSALFNMTSNWAIGALVMHVILFWRHDIIDSFKQSFNGTQKDRHYLAMKKYKEAPFWWYALLLMLSFLAGLIVVLKGDTTLPAWGYIVAILVGAFSQPFSGILNGRLGNGIATQQLMKMIAGAIHPGKPVANLYVLDLATDLKMGQYLKIPPRVMFLTQVYGTLLGAMINYAVMVGCIPAPEAASHASQVVITTHKKEILVDPIGDNVWSGFGYQGANSDAITWSLASRVYGIDSMYRWVPLGIAIGALAVVLQWMITLRWPKVAGVTIKKVLLPYVFSNVALLYAGASNDSERGGSYETVHRVGINSTITSTILLGIFCQWWLRRRHPHWFKKYNFLLGGAFDGGAQITLFILTFAVFGASGTPRPFPSWWGNRGKGNVDYCLMPDRALD